MRIGKIAASICIVFLIMMSFFTIFEVGGEPGTRPPPIKEGHIMTDEIWDVDYVVYNVVIDEGVTVTVNPGVDVIMEEDTYLYVEGTLVFNGTYTEPVNLRALGAGTTWDFFETNETGTFHFENFTIRDSTTAHAAFLHEGQPSVFKNGVIEGGYDGLYLWGDGGDLIENVTIKDTTYHGLVIRNNIHTTYVRDIVVRNVTRSALFLVESDGLDIDGVVADYELWGVYTFDVNGLTMKNIDLSGEPASFGFVLINDLYNAHISDSIIRGGDQAVSINTNPGSSVNFTNLVTTAQVRSAVHTFIMGAVDVSFTDCSFEASGLKTMTIISQGPSQRVDLINTTWTWSKPILAEGNVFVNISWYLEGMITDMAGEPMDGTLNINPSGSPAEDLILIEDGVIPMMEVMDRSISDMEAPDYSDEVFEYDLLFTPDWNGVDTLAMENVRFDNYTYLDLVINRAPTNSLPDTIEFEEDNITTTLNYTEYFQDDEELDYDIISGPEIDVHMRIHDGPHLEIMTNGSNWYGNSWLNISATDSGGNSTFGNITVIVTPVNDAPIAKLKYMNGTELAHRFVMNETPEPGYWDGMMLRFIPRINFSMAHVLNSEYMVFIDEDSPLEFWIDAYDVEGEDLSYNMIIPISFNGSLVKEVIQKVLPDNSTLNVTIDQNLTFNPDENYNGIEMITFEISDGNDTTTLKLYINVTPVNDAPVLNAPVDWNFTVKDVIDPTVELADLISDVDSELLTITVSPSSFASVNGTIITLTIPDDIVEDHVDIMVNVSDGELEDSAILRVYLTNDTDPGPGPDGKINVTSLEIIPDEDDWTINVYGEPGQTLFIVVENEDGDKTDHPLVYEDGKYTVDIDSDDAEEGSTIYISDSPGGEEILPELTDSLPELKEEKERNYMMYVLIAILAIILLSVMVYLVTRSKNEHEYEE